ncbi:MAG: hypothetical protein EOO48_02940 [Flavobacterium sp.]|nr:MAG: hypothetical protein EOO48_02940 [Flavobacterium sp.]
MKKIIVLFIFLLSAAASAQYDMYGTQYNGVDRSLTGQQYGNKKKKTAEKVDMVELSMKKLNEQLTLDSFQSAVIEQLLKENQEKEKQIVAQEIPDESKMEQVIAQRLKMNEKIKEVLRPDQVAIFENLGKKKSKK